MSGRLLPYHENSFVAWKHKRKTSKCILCGKTITHGESNKHLLMLIAHKLCIKIYTRNKDIESFKKALSRSYYN